MAAAIILGIGTDWAGLGAGHLPWPLLQWAFTTLPGLLIDCALARLLLGLPLGLLGPRLLPSGLRERVVAQAEDVTERPLSGWPRMAPRPEGRPHGGYRWVLVPGIAGIALLAGTAIPLKPHLYVCHAGACPPTYTTMFVAYVGVFGAFVIAKLVEWRWAGRMERTCGGWLRQAQRWPASSLLLYVRRPGVSAEEAEAALGRYLRRSGALIWLAEPASWLVVFIGLMCLALWLSVLLLFWLQTLWLPR